MSASGPSTTPKISDFSEDEVKKYTQVYKRVRANIWQTEDVSAYFKHNQALLSRFCMFSQIISKAERENLQKRREEADRTIEAADRIIADADKKIEAVRSERETLIQERDAEIALQERIQKQREANAAQLLFLSNSIAASEKRIADAREKTVNAIVSGAGNISVKPKY